MSVNVCLDDIFLNAEHFVTKLDMVMQHHELEFRVGKIVCCLQGHGHCDGSYDKKCYSFYYLF